MDNDFVAVEDVVHLVGNVWACISQRGAAVRSLPLLD